jgi:hypothetical protein
MKQWQEKVELKNQNIFGLKIRKEMEKQNQCRAY